MDHLFSAFDEVRREVPADPDSKLVLNMTGGYKMMSGFAMLYSQLYQIPSIYVHEMQRDTYVEIKPLPLSYAINELDEEISLLKGLSRKGGMSLNVDKTELPEWLQGMLTDVGEGRVGTTGFADILVDYFNTNRRKQMGIGRSLLDRTARGPEGRELADYLESCIDRHWAELWLGDQIPETVEHSRRHSKRLMEIGGNLFRVAEDQLEGEGLTEPLPLALLISAIYLHDIGHTRMFFPADDDREGDIFPLGLFPSSVREVHNLLSRDMIARRGEDLFPPDIREGVLNPLREIVPLLAAYHREYTPLAPGAQKEPKRQIESVGRFLYGERFEESLTPLSEVLECRFADWELEYWGITRRQILGVAGLLRIIDACDVQADRVVDSIYVKARLERTQSEARGLQRQLKHFGGALKQGGGNAGEIYTGAMEIVRKAERLDVDEAGKGNLDPQLGKSIKEACKGLYEQVFAELQRLKDERLKDERLMDRRVSAAPFAACATKNPALFQALSLANRVAFKWEQFLHFYKHRSVGFVLPLRGADGTPSICLSLPVSDGGEADDKAEEDLGSIIDEIAGEIRAVRDVGVLEGLDVTVRRLSEDQS